MQDEARRSADICAEVKRKLNGMADAPVEVDPLAVMSNVLNLTSNVLNLKEELAHLYCADLSCVVIGFAELASLRFMIHDTIKEG